MVMTVTWPSVFAEDARPRFVGRSNVNALKYFSYFFQQYFLAFSYLYIFSGPHFHIFLFDILNRSRFHINISKSHFHK